MDKMRMFLLIVIMNDFMQLVNLTVYTIYLNFNCDTENFDVSGQVIL